MVTKAAGRPPLPYRTKRMCLSLPEPLFARIEREAKAQRRPVTQMAKVMLGDWFEQEVDLGPHLPEKSPHQTWTG